MLGLDNKLHEVGVAENDSLKRFTTIDGKNAHYDQKEVNLSLSENRTW